jgi:hypothetical protein
MDDLIKIIPKRFRKWWFFLFLGIFFNITVHFILYLLKGYGYAVIPTNYYELGEFTTGVVVWGLGSLYIYWRYIVKGKSK